MRAEKFYRYSLGSLFFIGIVLMNLCFVSTGWRNYEDKMAILNQIIRADTDIGLDQAIQMMQSDESDSVRYLEQYGYLKSFQNRYYVDFLKQCMRLTGGSFFFLLLILFLFFAEKRQRQKSEKKYFKQLGQEIELLCKEKQDGQRESGRFKDTCRLPVASVCASEAAYLNDQLEMLRTDIFSMRKQAYEEKEKTKSIVTDISHQLKTPVAALDTCFSVMETMTLCEAEREEFFARCRNELDGLKTLLDALVQISYMETGMMQMTLEYTGIFDTLIQAANRSYPKASEKQMELEFDYEPELEQLKIWQDKKWLCEAFVNLMNNAIKYSPPESQICIRIQKRVYYVRIEIADQGIGIGKKERHKIFQRFYRSTDQRVRKESGSGIGLYLVRAIVERHHGTISVRAGTERKEGYPGSIFVVHLPV